jgi:hypothetical protein
MSTDVRLMALGSVGVNTSVILSFSGITSQAESSPTANTMLIYFQFIFIFFSLFIYRPKAALQGFARSSA